MRQNYLKHEPVMIKEVINFLQPKSKKIFVDATLGTGGHTKAILRRIGKRGLVIGIDRDKEILQLARQKLKNYPNIQYVRDNFANLKKILSNLKIDKVDGILVDLGFCFLHLQISGRGFSFQKNEPLDMRYDKESKLTAEKIINQYSFKDLVKIFKNYGEERYSTKIAREIIHVRQKKPIKTTQDLILLIRKALPPTYRFSKKIHFATKIFQSLRIEVNQELENLKNFIPQAIESLNKGGRIVVISYHSLEDRICKKLFKEYAQGCICPPKTPICMCGRKSQIKIITSKPIRPSQKEIKQNPKSRGAKLRAAEKII